MTAVRTVSEDDQVDPGGDESAATADMYPLAAVGAHEVQPPPYELGADSVPQPGVPAGTVIDGIWESDRTFAGSIRDYQVYAPAVRHDSTDVEPALMVFQDGLSYSKMDGEYRVPIVLDNLIAAGDIPPVIGVFVNPVFGGSAIVAARAKVRIAVSRSVQYNSLDEKYATFLIDELLPGLADRHSLTWSDDPERRAIGGFSSGGICAFTVAWNRPDSFRKVISHSGAFINIRGGDRYPWMIRRTTRKPLRVFLQSGSRDFDSVPGNIPLANQEMAAALRFKDYDYRFVYGAGRHDGKHHGAVLPDTLRWLWRS